MYFGPGEELFGLFHSIAAGSAAAGNRTGVLLCPPLGQDQIRCHRVYRQLAHALVADGIHTLRFDYYGTGDSAGSSVDVDWDRCLEDVVTAATELRARSGVDRVAAFGARLGGNLAMAAAAMARFVDIVAWDPVLDGSAYVTRLDAMQAELGLDRNRFTRARTTADTAGQWLGFSVSDRLRQRIGELRLAPPAAAAAPVLVLDSLEDGSSQKWQPLVAQAMLVKALVPLTPWDDIEKIETAILSHPLVQMVTQRLRAGASEVRAR